MAESYTGDEGDDALTAGYDVMDGNEDRRDGWRAINKVRDYVAQLKAIVDAINVSWASITGKPTTFPPSSHTHQSISLGGALFSYNSIANEWNSNVNGYYHGYLNVHGSIFNSSATPATSGYVTAYLNGDGRLSRGVSSERYKDAIGAIDPASLGDIFPQLHTFELIGDDTHTERVGYIAERLDEHPDQARFVVYNNDGQAESIDFIALLIAEVAQLHARVTELEAGSA